MFFLHVIGLIIGRHYYIYLGILPGSWQDLVLVRVTTRIVIGSAFRKKKNHLGLYLLTRISSPGLQCNMVHLEKFVWYVRVGFRNPMFRLLLF